MSAHENPIVQNEAAAAQPAVLPNEAATPVNHIEHELSPAHVVIPGVENADVFAELFANYKDEWKPQTQTEYFCVAQLAQAQWRICRLTRMETALYAKHGPAIQQFFAEDCLSSGILAKLERYVTSARQQYDRALRTLITVRREQRAHRRDDSPEVWKSPDLLSITPAVKTDPIPVTFANELTKLKKFYPDFDPARNKSKMSDALRDFVRDAANLSAARQLVHLVSRPTTLR